MKILYVEDDPFDADLTRRELLRSASHIGMDIVSTQAEALSNLSERPGYDLVLTDLNLPDGGGFELLAHIRQQELPLAVVVITGQGDEEMAVAVLKAGGDDYVVKRSGYLSTLPKKLDSAFKHHLATARKARPLHVLYAQASQLEGEQTRQYFSRHFPHISLEIVRGVQELWKELLEPDNSLAYDALVFDFRLGETNAIEVLKELRHERGLDVPVVVVTLQGDEETAARALLLGASDYLVKKPGYLHLLAGSLENAFHSAQLLREQAALEASEKRFQSLIENGVDGIAVLDSEGFVRYVSPSTRRILGFRLEEHSGENLIHFFHPEEQDDLRQLWAQLLESPETMVSTLARFRHNDLSWHWLELTCVNSLHEPSVRGIVANFRDVTERRQTEERIYHQLQRLNALRTIDMAIATSMDLRVTLAVLMESVMSQLGVHACSILFFNPVTQTLEFAAGRGFRTTAIETARFPLVDGISGWVALERQVLHLTSGPEVDKSGSFAVFWHKEGFASYYGAPLVAKGQIKGVLEAYHRTPFEPDQEWLNFFESLAGQAAIAIDNASLFEDLQRANAELLLAYDATLEGWVRALDLRDQETEGHTKRVAAMTVHLARAMGVSEDALGHIQRGALLHDIGKMAISDYILHKPGPLTEDEMQIVRNHPENAFDLLSPIPYLAQALEIPYCHHEKWDGNGYPRGLQGEQIPLAARIFAVVDVWDAITNDRVYRKRWDAQKAREYIRSCSGTHFDPAVVDVFMRLLDSKALNL